MAKKSHLNGYMDQCNQSSPSDFSANLERFEFFIEANDISKEKKQSIFLSVVGENTYALAKDLIQPSKIRDKSLNRLIF